MSKKQDLWNLSDLKNGIYKYKCQDFKCKVCGVQSIRDSYLYSHVADVCQSCADVISNLYNKAHSGEFITWKERDAPPVYEKKQIPESLRWKIFERDGFTCRFCGSQRMLRVDHIYPESKGGDINPENLQTLCNSCNCSKGNKIVD
jgi:5-methylcytosine-specific restriction endonuclease McrA